MYIWKNSKLKPLKEIEYLNNLLTGYGLFETILVHKTKGIILWDEHIKRLMQGISLLNGQKPDCDFKSLKACLTDKLKIFDFYRLKLIYLPSKTYLLVSFERYDFDNKPFKLYSNPQYFRGFLPHYKLKSVSYMENFFLKNMAASLNFDDYLILNNNMNVLETTIANIFFVKNDHIIETPPVCNNSLLDGIIRKYLIKNIIPEINIIEKNIEFFKIQNYKEVFITNSLKLVQNVDQINDYKYNNCNTSNIIRNFLIQKLW